jgi:hypothetical protein
MQGSAFSVTTILQIADFLLTSCFLIPDRIRGAASSVFPCAGRHGERQAAIKISL